MGSSGSETVEFAVGSIVWVRRRNGSWWPGKILGPHDLNNNHLMSPRSGTPVKLLGREDASVDWYNLEKSKRVKAFRCGDFDECIERAESSVTLAPKKREKYARREDAILHALELERQMMDSQVVRLDIVSSIKIRKASVSDEKGSGSSGPDDHNALEHTSDASPDHGNGFHHVNKMKDNTMPEDEAPPKMRALQEFGLRTNPQKRKLSATNKADEIDRTNNQFQGYNTSTGRYSVEIDSRYLSAPNQIKDAYWAKRSKSLYLPTESDGYSGNIKESSPTLKKVTYFPEMESKFPLHALASDDNAPEFSEDTESDSSDSDDSETDSDELNAVSGRGDEPEAEGRARHTSNEELEELALASDTPLSADDGVSKWKSKGKRNIRHLSKGSSQMPNVRVRMNDPSYVETRGNTLNNRVSSSYVNYQHSNGFDDYFDGDDSFDGEYWSPRSALGNTRHSALRRMPRGRSNNNYIHPYDWDAMDLDHRTPLNGYLLEGGDYYSSDQPYVSHGLVEGRRRNTLVEVDLKVQSCYSKQRVPIVSLLSKIDGRAIIGHSLQIERIAEGSSNTLLSKRSEFRYRRIQEEGDYPIPSGWKTARRTYRVRRPDLSSAVDSGEDAEYLPHGRKSMNRELNTSVSGVMHKYDPPTIHRVPNINPTRKLSKKWSLSTSQKTRPLSSFSIDHHKQRVGQESHDIEASALSEIIKSGSGSSTNAPCIPVKLIYSRLYEAVGKPPASVAPTNHEAELTQK